MAVLQAILAAVARSAGKLLNTVFGWATMLLFGKVPEERQIHLSVMALGSVTWLIVFLGVLFPALGVWLLTFVPLPGWLDENWVRLIMLAAAVLIPLAVGGIALRMLDPQERPKEAAGRVQAVLKGYPYTLGLALTLVLMTLFAPFLKLRSLVRRWETEHVPVVVEPNDYCDTADRIQEALQSAGWRTERRQANWMLRFPTKVLTLLAGGAIENLVAEQLTTLRGEALEVTLHPSDLVISGKEADVARARAVLAEQLAFSRAHLTWTKEAQEIEDRLEALWRAVNERPVGTELDGAVSSLRRIERDLKQLQVPYEEWEVLFRQHLLLERSLLQAMLDRRDRPREVEILPRVTAAGPEPAPERAEPEQTPRRRSAAAALFTLLLPLLLNAMRRTGRAGERRTRTRSPGTS